MESALRRTAEAAGMESGRPAEIRQRGVKRAAAIQFKSPNEEPLHGRPLRASEQCDTVTPTGRVEGNDQQPWDIMLRHHVTRKLGVQC